MDAAAEIKNRIERAFKVLVIEITDDSPKHAGHAAVKFTGGGHYRLSVVSPAFEAVGLLERHRMIYQALGDLMGSKVHALAIQALSETEWETAKNK